MELSEDEIVEVSSGESETEDEIEDGPKYCGHLGLTNAGPTLFRPNLTVNFEDFESAANVLKEYGVVVVTNVLTDENCKDFVCSMATMITNYSLGAVIEDQEYTSGQRSIWTPSATYDASICPPSSRFGMYNASIGNSYGQWILRSSDRTKKMFQTLYNDLVSGNVGDEFFASIDGISFHPDAQKSKQPQRDWAHVDRTTAEPELKMPNSNKRCDYIQGQFVFSESNSSFVCCPRSHLYYDKLIAAGLVPTRSTNYHKFSPDEIKDIKDIMGPDDSKYWASIIHAPKGSAIFWLSSTIHSSYTHRSVDPEIVKHLKNGSMSASIDSKLEPPRIVVSKDDAKRLLNFDYRPAYDAQTFFGWRCVFYVCLSPKMMVQNPKRISQTLHRAFYENRCTTHTARRLTGGGLGTHQFDGYQLKAFIGAKNTVKFTKYIDWDPDYHMIQSVIDYSEPKKRKPIGADILVAKKKSKTV